MKKQHILCKACACVSWFIAATLNAATIQPLEGRLETSPGSGVFLAYYDPNLNITLATDTFITGIKKDWASANAWAAGLTLGGISGWRLPNIDVNGDGTVVDCSGGSVAGCEDNEFGFLYWEEGVTLPSPDPFDNLTASGYWSNTPELTNCFDFVNGCAWSFIYTNGLMSSGSRGSEQIAWAVHSGDVPLLVSVPIPAAIWLFGSGLLGMAGMARLKKAA